MDEAVVTASPRNVRDGPDQHRQRASRHWPTRNLFPFVWAFVAVGLSVSAWSVATPLGAAPDEPTHLTQAAAVVRGQFNDRQIEVTYGPIRFGRVGIVEVPEWVTNIPDLEKIPDVPSCVRHEPGGAISCAISLPPSSSSDRTVLTGTEFSNYPPLYYRIVGVPTLVWTGSGALYGVRLVGSLLDSALIALGIFLLARYQTRRLTLLGAMVALTPMVLFISAVVSSSGMETAAGFAAWCGGLCVIERQPVIPRALAAWTSVSFVALILSRPLSPVNAVVIVAVLATLLGWRRSRALIREPSLRPIWIPALAAALAAGAFLVVVGSPSLIGVAEKPPLSFIDSMRLTLRLTGNRLHQCIGDFGWDHRLPAPRWVVALWTSALWGLLAYGVALSRRCRRALPLLVLAILAMPVIFESSRINTVGTYWQGRYWLPLAVGLPLVASSLEPDWVCQRARSAVVTPSVRLAGFVTVGALLIVAQVATFLTVLHHYEGLKWTPPDGAALVLALFIAGQILLFGFLTWNYRNQKRLSGVQSNILPRQPQPSSM